MDSKAEEINESDGELLLRDLHYVLEDDDKNKFLDIMNNLSYKPEVIPFTVISGIIIDCAQNITTAVLNGETGQKVDVKAVCPRTGESLLHKAAVSSDLKTVDTLLRLGARTDVRCNKGKLPLNAVLRPYIDHWCVDGFVHKWTPKHSLFSLIIRLWNPYKMRRGLEIVRLLFWNTDETEYEIYQYAKEGKVAELAVLLLVAGKKIMSPFIFEKIRNFSAPHGSKTLRQYITSEIASLTGLRTRLVHETGSYAFLQTCNDKLATMTSMLMLLEVFERVGDKIMAYYIHHSADDVCADMKRIKVTTDLAWLIQEAGFITDYADLHIKDRLNSKWEMVWESLRDQVNSEIEQEKSLYLRFPNSMDSIDLQLCGKKEKGKKKLWNVTVKHDGKMLKAKKSFTCNELDDDVILGFPYRARYLTKAHISREFATSTRAKAKSFPVTMAMVEPNFLLFKQYASVTLPILRRIRLL